MRDLPDRGERGLELELNVARFILVGAGAVGGTLGGLLATSGHEVVLLARGAHADALERDGLVLRTVERDLTLRLPVARSPGEVAWRPDDVALVCTKLQDAAAALDALRAAAGPGLLVVSAQNGLDGPVLAAERFERVVTAVVWMLSSHLEPGVVEVFSTPAGALDLGAHTPAAPIAPLAGALRAAGLAVDALDDAGPRQRTKLLTNLGNVTQLLALDDDARRALADEARAEAEAVLRAAGLPFVPVAELVAARMAVLRPGLVRGRKRPGGSTWQSHARGQPLEVDWLNGAIVRLAAALGRDAPVNRRLLQSAAALAP